MNAERTLTKRCRLRPLNLVGGLSWGPTEHILVAAVATVAGSEFATRHNRFSQNCRRPR